MHINENAPGNISQRGVTSGTDNETGFDPRQDKGAPSETEQAIDQLEGHELIEPREPGVEVVSGYEGEVTLPADDDALVDEDMGDVDVNNSVADEHPEPR